VNGSGEIKTEGKFEWLIIPENWQKQESRDMVCPLIPITVTSHGLGSPLIK
jgi:hypothetical protein